MGGLSGRRGCGRRGDGGFETGAEVEGGIEAEVRGEGEGFEDDGVDADADVDPLGWGDERAVGAFAGEHFVENDPEGVDVGAVIGGGTGALFGGGVGGGAGGGEVDGVGGWVGGGAVHDGGDAEVGDFDGAGFIDEEVFGFDVAVDDAVVVGALEGVADRGDDGEGFGGGETAGLEELAEIETVDEFHDEEAAAGGLAEVVDGDDVGVIEGGEGFGFGGEAGGEGWVGGAFRGEEFEGDEPVEGALSGFEDDAHAAAAEAFEDFELGEERLDGVDGGERLLMGWRGGGGEERVEVEGGETACAEPVDRVGG